MDKFCGNSQPETEVSMISQEPELVWQGRTQLGDEPGTFGDAAYSGLSIELPLTVRNTGATSEKDVITFLLTAEHVKVFPGYPGHLVKVFWYEETSVKYHWKQNLYKAYRLTSNDLRINVDLSGIKPSDPKKNIYISISVEVDTEVAPGLYNDFVLHSLSASSDDYKYVANLGFDYYSS
jgi:hypothetical protein